MIGLLLPTLFALVGAPFAGGSIAGLVRARMEWWWVVVGAFAVELVLYNPPVDTQAWALSIGPWLWVVMSVGIGLNTLVIVANGGHMPQSVEAATAVWGPQHAGPDAHLDRLQ